MSHKKLTHLNLLRKRIRNLLQIAILGTTKYSNQYVTASVSQILLNAVFQKLLRANHDVKWSVAYTSRVTAPHKIKIEDSKEASSVYMSFAVSGGCYIQAINGINIAKGVLWAPGVKIISANHSFTSYHKWVKTRPIKIEEYVWIGANAVILPGVHIGKYSIVGAGSVVTKDIPNYSIVAGVPARVVAKRCPTCKDKISLTQPNTHVCQTKD